MDSDRVIENQPTVQRVLTPARAHAIPVFVSNRTEVPSCPGRGRYQESRPRSRPS